MFDDILFPTDGSDAATAVLEHVIDIAVAHDATVHVLYVADTTRTSNANIQGQIVDTLEIEGEDIVEDAAEQARERGAVTETDIVQGEPYEAIVEYADANRMDVVVMPTRGRQGLGRLFMGSTTERVVRSANVPVLTLRPDAEGADADRPAYPYRNVLVPTDGSDSADQALSLGVDVATAEGAALHLLSVVAIESFGVDVWSHVEPTAPEEQADELLATAAETARAAGLEDVSTTVERDDSVHAGIRSYVDEHDVDLVVVGTHGRTGVERYLLGSVAESLVRTSPVPVLTVRAPGEAES